MWALFFMIRTSCNVESAHWPFWMGLMKRFLNSLTDPSRFSLMKFTMQWSGKETKITSFRYVQPKPHQFQSNIVYVTRQSHIQQGCFAEVFQSAQPSSLSWWSSSLWTPQTLRSSGCDLHHRSPSLDLVQVQEKISLQVEIKLGIYLGKKGYLLTRCTVYELLTGVITEWILLFYGLLSHSLKLSGYCKDFRPILMFQISEQIMPWTDTYAQSTKLLPLAS